MKGKPQPGHALPARDRQQYGEDHGLDLQHDEFEVRLGHKVPDLFPMMSISPAGDRKAPWKVRAVNGSVIILTGSPRWKNIMGAGPGREHVCHLPLVPAGLPLFRDCRVTRRKSTAFGVFPVHLQEDGKNEPIFAGCTTSF